MILKQFLFRSLCYFCRTLDYSPSETIQKLRIAFKTSTLPDSTIYRYYQKSASLFDIEPDFSIAVKPKRNEELLNKIRECIEEDRFYTAKQIAEIITADGIKTSKNTVKKYIKKYLKMKSISCRYIPHVLTEDLRSKRIACCKVQHAILTVLHEVDYIPLLTADETWLYNSYPLRRCYLFPDESPASIPRQTTHDSKTMMTTIISNDSIHYWMLPKNETITTNKWNQTSMALMLQIWEQKWRSLSSSQQEKVKAAILKAIERSKAIIQEEHMIQIDPLPGQAKVSPGEVLLLRTRSTKSPRKRTLTSQKKASTEESDTDEDEQHPTIELLPPRPRREAAKASIQTVTAFSASYLNVGINKDSEYQDDTETTDASSLFIVKPRNKDIPPCFVHYDNAQPHNSFEARAFLVEKTPFVRLCQPPYSPDVAVCDFFYFGYLKGKLPFLLHTLSNNINHCIKTINNSIEQSLLQRVFKEWEHRVLWIVEHRGDYYVDDARSRKEFSPPDIASLTTPSHPAKLFLTSADPLRGIVGLCGTPNSCYVQSILQCFLATLPLVKFACSENSPSILHEKTAIRTSLYAILESLIREVWIGEYSSPEAPSSVKADLTIHYILGNKIGRTLSYPDLFERLQSAVEERSRVIIWWLVACG